TRRHRSRSNGDAPEEHDDAERFRSLAAWLCRLHAAQVSKARLYFSRALGICDSTFAPRAPPSLSAIVMPVAAADWKSKIAQFVERKPTRCVSIVFVTHGQPYSETGCVPTAAENDEELRTDGIAAFPLVFTYPTEVNVWQCAVIVSMVI